MFLAIDVGNTQSTLGLFDEGGALVRGWRMSTDATDTSDMLHARLFSFFAKDGLSLSDVTEVLFSVTLSARLAIIHPDFAGVCSYSPPVAQVRTVPVQTPRTDNAMLKRMIDDLAELDTRLASASVGQGQIAYVREFQDETGQQDSEKKPASGTPSVAASSRPAVKPGDLLYAIIDVGVNSDVPSAVLATVTSGTYRNARLTGSFQRHDERLVLAFNRAVLPSGETVQLEAYAVDPSTSEASVASSVDTHFFSRWGGLIASAFLEGLGSAKRYSGAQSTIYGYGNDTTDQMVWNEYSVEDQAWIAAGKVGEKAGKIFEKGFDRPPTVRLESGTPVGVLVLNVKDR